MLDEKRPPDALFEEMRRAHSDMYAAVQRLRRAQEKMSVYYDHLSRWDDLDYPLRQTAGRCFQRTSEMMDACTGGIASVMALEAAQKSWDQGQKDAAVKAKPLLAKEHSAPKSNSFDPVWDSPYRAESYRPLPPVEEVDPELGEILGRYTESEEDDEDDFEVDGEDGDEDDEDEEG